MAALLPARRLLLLATLLLLAGLSGQAHAANGYLLIPPDAVREASPAYRYANLTNEQAYADLDRRGVPYQKVGRIGHVRAPVRLTGRLHGVLIHSSLPAEQRTISIFEILDARLALALDDFSALLERHEIVEVVHYTMYRPNGPRPGQGGAGAKRQGRRKGKPASKAQRKGGGKHHGARKGRPAGKQRRARAQSRRPGLGKASTRPKSRHAHPRHPKQKTAAIDKPQSKHGAKTHKAKTHKARGKKRSGSSRRRSTKGRHTSRQRAAHKAHKKSRQRRTHRGKANRRKKRGRRRKRAHAAPRVHKKLWAPPGTRHPAGLAIDVGALKKRDGRWLSVAHHFEGGLGAPTCSPRSAVPKTPEGRELRSLVCECADALLFTYVLTPNYDAAHADHFHMEIRGDVNVFSYH